MAIIPFPCRTLQESRKLQLYTTVSFRILDTHFFAELIVCCYLSVGNED